ncbi:MAG TPA: PD-(D/E)XK nuclease family protein [Steroidobacteraceae bacterium]|nr:PD-(D/E)XK nuclease family protein [Steroidobacteraceae bacterium]
MFRLKSDVTDLLQRGGTLIVPTRERAHAVRLAQSAARLAGGEQVWASADVLAAASWLRREAQRIAAQDSPASGPRVLSGAEEWFLWRQSAADITAGLPLLNGATLGDSLQRASRLAYDYRIELQRGAAPGSEAQLLFRARQVFAERCQGLGAVSADALLAGTQHADAGSQSAIAVRGFDALSPRLAALVGVRGAPDDRPEPVPELMLCADEREELERIAGWCREQVLRQADARLLIMLPGAPGARERLAALIRQALDPRSLLAATPGSQALVGTEAGQPLSEVPLIAHALTSLELLGGGELDGARLSAWLRAPYWSSPTAAARARLELKLRDGKLVTARLRELLGALGLMKADLQPAARECDAHLTRAARALGAGGARLAPRTWSERCRAALEATGWPGPLTADGPAREILMRWHELLEEFGELSGSSGPLSCGEALRLLEARAARSPLRAADEDVTVTISAVLADPIVRYDGIWVAQLHADVFPQAVAPDPFLPIAAQRAAGVPAASASGRLAQARTWLRAWHAGADELVLSAPRHAGDMELLASPLLKAAPLPPRSAAVQWLPATLHRAGALEALEDSTGIPWNAATPLPRGTRALDLQNTCPFRAYAELRLGSLRPEIPEPGIPALDRGTLLHAALEKLWGELRDSAALAALSAAALERLITDSVEGAALALLARATSNRRRRQAQQGQLDMFAAMPKALARECERAARLIRDLCQLDRQRSPFRVESTERAAELVLAGARVAMRIDRVDLLATGGRAVLDYKTGSHASGHWYDERPTYPQLLAYLTALGEEVTALATVWVSARTLRFDGVARDSGLLPGVRAAHAAAGAAPADAWRAQRQAWRAVLERLIHGFLGADATVDPKPGACRHCHVINICRIAEREDADAGGEGADE